MINDHLKPHGEIFEKYKIESMIEFGLGEGTRFFLDHLKRVVSVELYTEDKNLAERLRIPTNEWMIKFGKEFATYKNWEIIPYECRSAILNAERDVTGHGRVKRGENPISSCYKKEIRDLVKKLFKNKRYDYAFVDAGIHLRGDIVNELFGRVDIIGAHDTNTRPIYGYNRIIVPLNYNVLEDTNGEGVTFWIKKCMDSNK